MPRREQRLLMPTNDTPDDLPRATVVRTKRTRLSVVWIIPVLAALVAVGIAIQRLSTEGPTITIVFAAGAGIEAGKTPIKYKDVNVGEVTSVQLVDNLARVQVTAKIARSAAGLMVEDSKFWVVKPQIGLTGISGLSTVLSGNYIGVQAGKSQQSQRAYIGLDVQPLISDQPGRRFVLRTTDLGSLSLGAPIYYHRLPVGQVESYQLADDGKSVEISVFVTAPFDKHVQPETRFWNVSGIDLSIGETGVDVRTASLMALLVGGLSFDTPEFAGDAAPAPEGAAFPIYSDRAMAMKQPDAFARRYVLMFDEPVRGLAVGAPVTLMGLTVGEVLDVGLRIDPKTAAVHAQVQVTFYPERAAAQMLPSQHAAVKGNSAQERDQHVRLLRRLVDERGLRAHLRSTSLVSNQKYVSFEFVPHAKAVHTDWGREALELPVGPGQFGDMEVKLASILGKVDSMPIAAIGAHTEAMLVTLEQTLKDADTAFKDVDGTTLPRVKTALDDLHRVLDSAEATLVGRNSTGQQSLRDALQEVSRAARSLRDLTDYLDRHPEALLRGKSQENK